MRNLATSLILTVFLIGCGGDDSAPPYTSPPTSNEGGNQNEDSSWIQGSEVSSIDIGNYTVIINGQKIKAVHGNRHTSLYLTSTDGSNLITKFYGVIIDDDNRGYKALYTFDLKGRLQFESDVTWYSVSKKEPVTNFVIQGYKAVANGQEYILEKNSENLTPNKELVIKSGHVIMADEQVGGEFVGNYISGVNYSQTKINDFTLDPIILTNSYGNQFNYNLNVHISSYNNAASSHASIYGDGVDVSESGPLIAEFNKETLLAFHVKQAYQEPVGYMISSFSSHTGLNRFGEKNNNKFQFRNLNELY